MEECGFRRPACHGPRGMFLDKLEECCTLVAAAGTKASAELADCADSSLAPADSSALVRASLLSIGVGPSSARGGAGPARPMGSGEPVPTIEAQGIPSAAGTAGATDVASAVAMFVVTVWCHVRRHKSRFSHIASYTGELTKRARISAVHYRYNVSRLPRCLFYRYYNVNPRCF